MTKVRLINLTAHPLRIKTRNGIITLARHGLAGVKATHQHCDTLLVDGHEVELVRREYHGVSGLPPKQRGVLYVVSEKTATAVPDRDDLVVPALLRKDKNGRILYCGGLARLKTAPGGAHNEEQRD